MDRLQAVVVMAVLEMMDKIAALVGNHPTAQRPLPLISEVVEEEVREMENMGETAAGQSR